MSTIALRPDINRAVTGHRRGIRGGRVMVGAPAVEDVLRYWRSHERGAEAHGWARSRSPRSDSLLMSCLMSHICCHLWYSVHVRIRNELATNKEMPAGNAARSPNRHRTQLARLCRKYSAHQ